MHLDLPAESLVAIVDRFARKWSRCDRRLLTGEEKQQLQQDCEDIVLSHIALIVMVCSKHIPGGLRKYDTGVISAAIMHVYEVINRFDPSRASQPSTFIYIVVQNFLRSESPLYLKRMVATPPRVFHQYINKLAKADPGWHESDRRAVEAGQETMPPIGPDVAVGTRRLFSTQVSSVHTALTEGALGGQTLAYSEIDETEVFRRADAAMPEDVLNRAYIRMRRVHPRGEHLVELIRAQLKGVPYSELAEKHGYTRQRAQQLHKKAMQLLADILQHDKFALAYYAT